MPSATAAAIARDVVYLIDDGRLSAVTSTGEALWRLDVAELAPAGAAIDHLAPLARRLYGAASDGTVFCLEEGA